MLEEERRGNTEDGRRDEDVTSERRRQKGKARKRERERCRTSGRERYRCEALIGLSMAGEPVEHPAASLVESF